MRSVGGIFIKIAFFRHTQAAETGKLPDFIKHEVVWTQAGRDLTSSQIEFVWFSQDGKIAHKDNKMSGINLSCFDDSNSLICLVFVLVW